MNLTPKRLAWLRRLEIGPAHRPSRGNIGFPCMQEGWTEWNYERRDNGEPITVAHAIAIWGRPLFWDMITVNGERLTDAGRAVLAQAKAAGR